MYIPSLNEFSNLNYNKKIKIVEKIQNIIESQKKKYLRKNNDDEILIDSYYPKNKDKEIYNDNDLSSSTSSEDINIQKENDIIEKARNNIIKAKKYYEAFMPQYHIYKYNYEKDKNRNIMKETIPDQEINYIVESTTNSYDSSYYNEISNNYVNNNINNNISNIKHKIPFNNNNNYNHYNSININKSYTYNKNILNKKNKLLKQNKTTTNKNILKSLSQRNYTKSSSNNINKDNNNNINVTNIKKKLNFNEINKNSNNKSLMRTLSNTHRQKINENNISNRLYNMDKIIKEKIQKKKKELEEEEEMKNCSFVPKINNKSRKIVNKIMNENKKEIKNLKFRKINAYHFFERKK